MKYLLKRMKYEINYLIFKYKKPKRMQEYNNNKLLPLSFYQLKEVLFLLYHNRSGYTSALSREDQTLAQQNIFLTYGEILPEGLAKLFNFIKPTVNDSFVDLGSGVGKAVMQSYLASEMTASYGVEIDKARNNIALEALEELKQSIPNFFTNKAKIIELHNTNIIDFDFNLVSIVFCNATCFGPNLMGVISNKINNSRSVRAVMSTCRIEGLVNLTQENIVDIEVSWHLPPSTSPCYVYTLSFSDQHP